MASWGEAAHHIDTDQDLKEETAPTGIQERPDNGGSIHQKSCDRELSLLRLDGKVVSELKLKDDGHSVRVSVRKIQASTQVEPSGSAPELKLTYSHGREVPKQCVENMRNKDEGKSDEIGQIYSHLADHLQGFKKANDCHLLPTEEGILISSKEIITSANNIIGVTEPRRGKVFLEATVSQERCITYRHGQLMDGGNFFFDILTDEIAEGCEGTVYAAFDVRTAEKFAVKKMKITKQMVDRNPFSAFLKLPGCEQTCRAYGVILDEADNSVYFLMELLEGKTLSDLLGDKTPVGIPQAVNWTIHILRGLRYIHSEGMIHDDICEPNIMILGPKLARAKIIDTTAARKATSPKSRGYLHDVEEALNLLNITLLIGAHDSSNNPSWKASKEDRKKFNNRALDDLETIVEKRAESKSSMTDHNKYLKTLLKDLGEIADHLEDEQSPSESSASSEDETELSSKDQGASVAEPGKMAELEKLRKEFEELKAEKEKSKKDWKEKQEKLENQTVELQESVKKLSLQTFNPLLEQKRENQVLMEKLEASEANARKWEQETKRYKYLYEQLKAKGLEMQETADKNEDPRAEE